MEDEMTEHAEHIVIVGTGSAGHAAHEELRSSGFAGPITIIGHESHEPYVRPPLSKGVLMGSAEPSDAMLGLSDAGATTLRLGVEVTGVNVEERTLTTSDGDISYDKLLIATGGIPLCPAPWREAGALTLRSWDDALAIRAAAEQATSAIVIGGGFIGTEVASSLRQRGLAVTLVAADAQLLPATLEAGGSIVESLHRAAGTDVRLDAKVERVEARGGGGVRVVLADATELTADMLVVGIGVAPATAFLDGSGIERDERGAVCADERLIVPGTHNTVAVAGDIALAPHPLARGKLTRVEHWFWASGQGKHAARSLLGASEAHTDIPVFGSLQEGTKIFVHGLPHLGTERIVRREDGAEPVLAARFETSDGEIVGCVTVNADAEQAAFKEELARTAELHAV